MNPIIAELENEQKKKTLPNVEPGDLVKVFVLIKEGNKERTQPFEGVVIKKQGCGFRKTITVRRVFQGIGVERVIPLHSPKIEDIKILRKGNVRRARLYYLRERTGKAARIKEKVTR
ncbi:MAG TPA: 50S ribosomal protein L19 [Candidatus Gastranaerophilales bacterium]|nr:50S ribosomal protein L19 [Candidatus Gastranaerophilales bacterium]